MGTLRWERENEDRRARRGVLTESELRHKQAELALAQSKLQIETARAEHALREAELQRIKAERSAAVEQDQVERAERTLRRGGEPGKAPAEPANDLLEEGR